MATYYKLPFFPGHILEGDGGMEANKKTSIQQNIELMLATKQPEECSALPGYGSLIKSFHFLMPPQDSGVKWQTIILKKVKDSLTNCINLYEPRLHQPQVFVALIDALEKIDQKKETLGIDNLPRGYLLEIQIEGRIKTEEGYKPFRFDKQISLG